MTDFWQIGETGERSLGSSISLESIIRSGWFRGSEQRLRERLTDLPADAASSDVKYGVFRLRDSHIEPVEMTQTGQRLTFRERWVALDRLFDRVCRDLFRERRVEALQLRYPEGSPRRGPRWMDTYDLKFLINLGLRLLI